MDIRTVIQTKRDGRELSSSDIERFLRGYVAGDVPEYQAAAMLMAIFIHGFSDAELECWTRTMLNSGRVMSFADLGKPIADKHSTGGVGDKASIPLAPAVAACGVAVPMISGRGLGHTGGTLDKLESIPGFRTDLSEQEFARAIERVGVGLGAQTEDLVPADRKLYALRDATGLVESIPLIASSILSKKLAEGLDALVLDVKFGSGAFITDIDRGAELARTMIRLAEGMGVRTVAYQTNMARPLGRTAGHTLEIEESLDCLRGAGPADLRELVCLLGGEMLALTKVAPSVEDGSARIAAVLDDGSAFETFQRAVSEQGGATDDLDDTARLPHGNGQSVLRADHGGVARYRDVRALGRAVASLGGGRAKLGDPIDLGVGLRFLFDEGDPVETGDGLVEIHHRDGRGLEHAMKHLLDAIEVGEPFEPQPLVLARFAS